MGVANVLEALGPNCVSGLDRLAIRHDASVGQRLELWQQAITVWLSSPSIGVGAFGFGPTVYALESLDLPRGTDIYAHNIVLQILAEFGLVGAGALVAVALLLTLWLIRARRQLSAHDAFLLLVVASIATHSMLEFPLWYTYFLAPFCLALGLLTRPEWAHRAPLLSLRMLLLATAAALLVVAGFLFNDYRNLDRLVWIEIFRRDMAVAPTPEIRARIDEALADVRLFRVRAEFFASLSEPLTADDLPRKISQTDHLLKREMFPLLIVRRIALAILDRDEATARRHLRRMLAVFPSDTARLTEPLRQMALHHPDEFSALGPMLDEELARRPTPPS